MSGPTVLEHADVGVDDAAAAALVRALYGIDGRAVRLSGERDQNFRIDAGPRRYVLKLSNSAEAALVTDLQTSTLAHLAGTEIPVPRLIRSPDGAVQHRHVGPDGAVCEVRLLSYLEGRPLAEVEAGDAVLGAVGAALAALNRRLQDFAHPADDHDLLWDLKRAARISAYLPAIPDAAGRALAQRGLALFAERALPRLDTLRRQVIHNDLNPHNVLIADDGVSVSGVLDFGDAVRSPLVNDVAVAAAYHVRPGPAPLAGVAALVRGFHRVLPLTREEFDLLPPLIAGRLAMTAAISAWRAERYPANAAYILRNAPAAFHGLEQLLSLSARTAADQLRAAADLAA